MISFRSCWVSQSRGAWKNYFWNISIILDQLRSYLVSLGAINGASSHKRTLNIYLNDNDIIVFCAFPRSIFIVNKYFKYYSKLKYFTLQWRRSSKWEYFICQRNLTFCSRKYFIRIIYNYLIVFEISFDEISPSSACEIRLCSDISIWKKERDW